MSQQTFPYVSFSNCSNAFCGLVGSLSRANCGPLRATEDSATTSGLVFCPLSLCSKDSIVLGKLLRVCVKFCLNRKREEN